MLSGKEYLDTLDDGRVVFVDGERVTDVARHPLLAKAASIVAEGYDRNLRNGEAAAAEALTFPRTEVELRRRVAQLGDCEPLLLTTIESLLTLRTSASRIGSSASRYGEAIEGFVQECRDGDLRVAQTITDAKGDRALGPAAQEDPDVYLRVVEERPDGVVINGAKLHITGAALAHELIVIPTKRMKTGEEAWAVACAVPVNAPGITILNSIPAAASRDSPYYPFSRHRGMPEGFVIFDHVFVPRERLFLCGEVEHSAIFAHALGLWNRLGGAAQMVEDGDLLVGLASLVIEANGLGRVPHIKDKLAELVLYATLIRAGLEAAIGNADRSPEGFLTPSELYTNAAKYYGARHLSEMLHFIHDISGGSLITAPLPGDLENETTRPFVEKYMRTMSEVSGSYRTRLFHAVRDITADSYAGWWQVASTLGGGGLHAQKLVTVKHFDMERARRLALDSIGLEVEGDPPENEEGKPV